MAVPAPQNLYMITPSPISSSSNAEASRPTLSAFNVVKLTRILSDFSYFQALTASDIHWLIKASERKICPAGTILIKEGEAASGIYFLTDRRLNIFISSRSGIRPDHALKQLPLGEMLGEMSFLDNHLPLATVQTVNSCEVLHLGKERLAEQLERNRDFSARFHKMLALKLATSMRELSPILIANQVMTDLPLRKALLAFSVLNDSDTDWMITHGIQKRISAKATLIQEGESVDGLYLLLKGSLDIYIAQEINGDYLEKKVGVSLKGEILGEMSFVENDHASATVRAAEDSVLLMLPRQTLSQKLQCDRRFADRFYRAIAIILTNRWRDRLAQRGLLQMTEDSLDEDVCVEDELDFDVLDSTALSSARFDWILRHLEISPCSVP